MTDAAATSTAPRVQLARERLRDYVRSGHLPMLLVELPSGSPLEISRPMMELLGIEREAAMRRSAPDFTDNPESTRASMRLLADGTLDGYRRRVQMPRGDGSRVEVVVGVDACDNRGPDRVAVVTVLPAERGPALSEPSRSTDWSHSSVVGTITADGVIDRIVSDDTHILAEPSSELLEGRMLDLLHPEDAGVLTMLAAHASARAAAVTGRVRLRCRDGAWQYGRLALQPLAPSRLAPDRPHGFAFALSLEPLAAADPDTVAVFERASDRNSQQLKAASAAAHMTLIAAVMDSPDVAALSAREREIVTRILASQRVPAIARELYLSQSTVRNHLTGVYRKLGVSSQVELLELLRPRLSTD